MKVTVDQLGGLVLKEIYSGVLLETSEGNKLGACMRDDTIELSVVPKGGKTRHFRVNMQNSDIEEVVAGPCKVVDRPEGGGVNA